jgi:hypothetical protein
MPALEGRCRPQTTDETIELVLHNGTIRRVGTPLTYTNAKVVCEGEEPFMLRHLALITVTALALAALVAAAMLPEPETNAPDGCDYPLVRCNR